jgi:hypothetical protein
MRSMVEGAHVQSSDAPPTILRSLREARMAPPSPQRGPHDACVVGCPSRGGMKGRANEFHFVITVRNQ